jgi:hypothetical protein
MFSNFRRTAWLPVAVLGLALAAFGCSDDDDDDPTPNPPAGSTVFTGTMAGQTQSGTVALTVNTAASGLRARRATDPLRVTAIVSVTGVIELTGFAPVSITGNYDTDTNTLTASGGGYSLTGTLTGNRLAGTWTGPAGASGAWSAQYGVAAGDTVRVFCGTFTSTSGGDDGWFNLVTSGTTVNGVAVSTDDGTHIALTGTLTDAGAVDSVHVASSAVPGTIIARGIVNTTLGTASGSFDTGTNSGVWTGERCDD